MNHDAIPDPSPATTTRHPRELFGTERLLAFSDGVFAVAITLLVIDLQLPSSVAPGDAALLAALRGMLPKFTIFGFTFLVVGLSWLAHHRKFSYVRRIDGPGLWLNLLHLLTLCLVPFATAVLSARSGRIAFVLYATVMSLNVALSSAMAAYVLRAPFLAESGPPRSVRRDLIFSPLWTTSVFLLAGGLALLGWADLGSNSLLLIIPVAAFFGSRARAELRRTHQHGR